MIKTTPLLYFTYYISPKCSVILAPLANTSCTRAPTRIKRYFEDYKSQIINRIAGIGQRTKGGRERKGQVAYFLAPAIRR